MSDEDYCPECDTKMPYALIRVKHSEGMTEKYYCWNCSQDYEYRYELKDIIKK
jgi:hypothetical protein